MGNAPDYIRHVYKVDRELKSYSIFKFVEVERSKNLLTDVVRIEPHRGMSNTKGAKDYLRLRDTSNWSKCSLITGLRQSKNKNIYYGDCDRPGLIGNKAKTLLLFRFSEYRKHLEIFVYRDFYPFRKGLLQSIIDRLK
jgi:hypothetical protein